MSFADSLRALVEDGSAVWGFLSAAGIVLLLTPFVARLAPRIGAVDDPGASDRPRVHERPLPRTGGLAIVAGIAIPTVAFIRPEGRYLGILLGTLCVAGLGLVDDIRGIRPSIKLLGVVVAALIPVVGFDVTWRHASLPLLGSFNLGDAAYPATIF
jgi:UDP-GlcNAc:undecaprenyl-phosphate GlcNAc-1-phosphate transferase